MTHEEMLEWVLDHPEIMVRKQARPRKETELWVICDTSVGLETLATGATYQEAIESATSVLKAKEEARAKVCSVQSL
ncbi:hypothetical protein LCGC14_1781910 [marine sediment metagenome]|uniref:HicB-like antitoxin of toxin-antitoxin system domain-containing protein n=1 Tax=marine sediment metagenome TaxID=412755 RepID=A0A0F9HHR4_9ZZZZ